MGGPSSSLASLSPEEFAGKVRDKYPGVYDHLADADLTQKIVQKYPDYGNVIRPSGVTGPASPEGKTAAGRAMHESYSVGNPDTPRVPMVDQVKNMALNTAEDVASVSPYVVGRNLYMQATRPKGDPEVQKNWERTMRGGYGMAMMGLGGEDVPMPREIPPEMPVRPSAPAPVWAAMPETAIPGRAARVAEVGIKRIPGVKLARDLHEAWNGPETAPPPPPVPQTNGIPWGSGGQGPLELRGKMIPRTPVYPGANLPENPGVFPGAHLPENPGEFPGAHLPAKPPNEVLNPSLVSPSRGLPGMWGKEVTRPPQVPPPPSVPPLPPRPGLLLRGQVERPAVSEYAAPQEPLAQKLDRTTKSAFDIPRPQPGKPIFDRFKNQPIPEGHTPVESSALRSWKYDPQTKVFSALTKDGTIYTHGEVTPAEAEAFGNAESKGKAWADIRNNHVNLGKNAYGETLPRVKSASRIATPESKPPQFLEDMGPFSTTRGGQLDALRPPPKPMGLAPPVKSAAAEDLTPQLQKSLDLTNSKKTGMSDRRADLGQRQKVAQMSPEEMRKTLLTSDKTGLPNRRAFDEGSSPAVGMSDADGLKALNDKFGYDAGDHLLKVKADALREAGLDAYHDKGDEFLYRAKSPEELRTRLDKARNILKNTEITFTTPEGIEKTFKGADFSYGVGNGTEEAEQGLKLHKTEREARGERARGELRGIVEQ